MALKSLNGMPVQSIFNFLNLLMKQVININFLNIVLLRCPCVLCMLQYGT